MSDIFTNCSIRTSLGRPDLDKLFTEIIREVPEEQHVYVCAGPMICNKVGALCNKMTKSGKVKFNFSPETFS